MTMPLKTLDDFKGIFYKLTSLYDICLYGEILRAASCIFRGDGKSRIFVIWTFNFV